MLTAIYSKSTSEGTFEIIFHVKNIDRPLRVFLAIFFQNAGKHMLRNSMKHDLVHNETGLASCFNRNPKLKFLRKICRYEKQFIAVKLVLKLHIA